jgi:hypothetical protein
VARAAETIDRVVASVDGAAITRSDVETAYRFEAFLNGETPKVGPDAATLALVRDRLINQMLLLREADAGKIPADDYPDDLGLARKTFRNEEAFQAALRSLDLDERQVVARLRDRHRILLLIEQRLRPSARVERPEIEAYYKNTFVPEYTRRGGGNAPPLAQVESQIQEILTQKTINQLLDKWLANLKLNHRVDVLSI